MFIFSLLFFSSYHYFTLCDLFFPCLSTALLSPLPFYLLPNAPAHPCTYLSCLRDCLSACPPACLALHPPVPSTVAVYFRLFRGIIIACRLVRQVGFRADRPVVTRAPRHADPPSPTLPSLCQPHGPTLAAFSCFSFYVFLFACSSFSYSAFLFHSRIVPFYLFIHIIFFPCLSYFVSLPVVMIFFHVSPYHSLTLPSFSPLSLPLHLPLPALSPILRLLNYSFPFLHLILPIHHLLLFILLLVAVILFRFARAFSLSFFASSVSSTFYV